MAGRRRPSRWRTTPTAWPPRPCRSSCLDARRDPRRWPQWRLDDDVTGLWQAQGGLADPFKGNAAHRRLAPAHGATLRDRAPVTAIRDAGGGDLEVVTPAARPTGPARVVLAADAWTNDLLAPFGRRLPLTITKEQVTYFACPDPAAFAPGSLPGLDLDGRAVASTASRPTARPGPKAAQDCGGRPVDPDRGRSSATRRPSRGSRRSWPTHLPGAVGPPIYTKTCLYTLTPDRDFVVDRLPERARASSSRSAPPTASSSPRSSAGSLAELERRRRDAVGRRARRASGSTGRSCSRPTRRRRGWSERPHGARYGSAVCAESVRCANVPPVPGREGPAGGDFGCDCPCAHRVRPRRSPAFGLVAGPDPRRPRLAGRRPPTRSSCASARPRTLDSHQPVPERRRRRRLRDLRPSTTTCSSGSARTSSRCPGFAESWTRSADGLHLDVQDPTRHEVVGRPAGDVRGRPLDASSTSSTRQTEGRHARPRLPRART